MLPFTIAILISLLELAFTTTSGVLVHFIPQYSWSFASLLYQVMGVSLFNLNANLDYRCLELLASILVLLVVYHRKSGIPRAVLKSIQTTSIILVALPIEVYIFLPHFVNTWFTTALIDLNLKWFTNEVLLVLTLYTLFASSVLLWSLGRHKKMRTRQKNDGVMDWYRELDLQYQCDICKDWYWLYLHTDHHLKDGRTVCKHCFRSDPTLE